MSAATAINWGDIVIRFHDDGSRLSEQSTWDEAAYNAVFHGIACGYSFKEIINEANTNLQQAACWMISHWVLTNQVDPELGMRCCLFDDVMILAEILNQRTCEIELLQEFGYGPVEYYQPEPGTFDVQVLEFGTAFRF